MPGTGSVRYQYQRPSASCADQFQPSGARDQSGAWRTGGASGGVVMRRSGTGPGCDGGLSVGGDQILTNLVIPQVEKKAVGQVEQHEADVQQQGLPDRDVQPPGHEGDGDQDQAALEAESVRDPDAVGAVEADARLQAVEQPVVEHVPGDGDRGDDCREHAHVEDAAPGDPGGQGGGDANGEDFERQRVEDAFGQRAVVDMHGTAIRCGGVVTAWMRSGGVVPASPGIREEMPHAAPCSAPKGAFGSGSLAAETWGDRWGSNPRQPESQSGTLPTELRSPLKEREF